MIVRDAADAWQVVLQTDHAELSGALAEAWADTGPRHASVVVAARRHDDGWAVWERSPLVDAGGEPVNFLDVQVPAHLAFYRAGIAAITDEDPYAGLLVSMHGAGIYRQRYGEDPGLRLAHAADKAALVDAFVAEQEESVPARLQQAGVDDELRWADYRRLQAYDRLSLLFCLRDLATSETFEVGAFAIEPRGPWRIGVDPFPLDGPARFALSRRLVPKRAWTQEEFRVQFPALPVERVEIVVEP
ncbi:MAG TPA: DUF3891 family protein [Gaiellaceae bacterium]|nr:DUF3891 family protein [Gaiellaceae bacterium]